MLFRSSNHNPHVSYEEQEGETWKSAMCGKFSSNVTRHSETMNQTYQHSLAISAPPFSPTSTSRDTSTLQRLAHCFQQQARRLLLLPLYSGPTKPLFLRHRAGHPAPSPHLRLWLVLSLRYPRTSARPDLPHLFIPVGLPTLLK